jgi:hypothetical protein
MVDEAQGSDHVVVNFDTGATDQPLGGRRAKAFRERRKKLKAGSFGA